MITFQIKPENRSRLTEGNEENKEGRGWNFRPGNLSDGATPACAEASAGRPSRKPFSFVAFVTFCESCFGVRVKACIAALAALFVLNRSPAAESAASTGVTKTPLQVSGAGKAGFTRLDPQVTGILFTNHLSDAMAAANQVRMNGSGVAFGDVDGDGRCDLYFCRLEGANALFRNLGDWKFQEITSEAGVACPNQFSTGAVLADIDGDRDLDLLVSSIGNGVRCFLNDGKGRFREATDELGLRSRHGSMTMALADIDGDNDLDLYVANYRTNTMRSLGLSLLEVNGRRILRPEDAINYQITASGLIIEHGEPDLLFLNDGKGKFSPVPWAGGIFLNEDSTPLTAPPRDWGLSVQFRDFSGDGAPDIYVCNDFGSPDRIWINDGRGAFRALPQSSLRSTSGFSMGVDFSDIDRDGDDDFFVVDMLARDHRGRMMQLLDRITGPDRDRAQKDRNTLQRNNGDGTFSEIAYLAQIEATGWSWSTLFLDVDLDGWEDILITCGHLFNTQDRDTDEKLGGMTFSQDQVSRKLLFYPRHPLPNLAFRNARDLTFEDKSKEWGFDFVGVSHGMAFGDLDNDGDLDLVVNHLNAAAGVYRNETAAPRVAIRLKGLAGNSAGTGSRLVLKSKSFPSQSQEVLAGGRYLSGSESLRVFAGLEKEMELEVHWRSGRKTFMSQVTPNVLYEIDESAAKTGSPTNSIPPIKPFFEEASHLINHFHQEEAFDDFELRQRALVRKLSELGPGLAWFDYDGDGWEDLMIGGARGGIPALFRNKNGAGFDRLNIENLLGRPRGDQTAVLGWANSPGSSIIIIGQSSYEAPEDNGALAFELWAGGMDLKQKLLLTNSTCGTMALGDWNGDGQLELFIGGAFRSGRFPESADSQIYTKSKNGWVLDEISSRLLKEAGLVSGAVFSDLDNDGNSELILACQWGGLRVFSHSQAETREITSRLGLERYQGIWNGVATGDFDGDGNLEIVASNWGRNTPYERFRKEGGIGTYYGDSDDDGSLELFEAYFDKQTNRWKPLADLAQLSTGMPWLRGAFKSHAAFAESGVEELAAARNIPWKKKEVQHLETSVFFRRDGKFEPRALPLEAQISPAFGLATGDLDGDGAEDIFLCQNFFGVTDLSSRLDSGRGVWLKNNLPTGWLAMTPAESGILIDGEGRGCALSDFNHDGRVDLAVTQNGGQTKLYRNVRSKEGLRVRLAGPPGNPTGIGGQIRLIYGPRMGPVREVHGGGGYWSQDSAIQVLGKQEGLTGIWIRWPGGKVLQGTLPQDAKEITAMFEGKFKLNR